MAGVYIHIPFCKQSCSYCNFHFSTSLRLKEAMVDAICAEISVRKNYLASNKISSVYFGGGTPSLLEQKDLDNIWNTLIQNFNIENGAEITLEANPDDLDSTKLDELAAGPINRLSIGVQSFFNEDLSYMGRAHSAEEAIRSIDLARDKGFSNITLDLIYGTPTLTTENWTKNLQTVLDIGVPHLSAYQLTVENGTTLHALIARGKKTAPPEEKAVTQFNKLMDWAEASGFEHYEISNFARRGHHAVHNSSYWSGAPYLGIGPSAHSFNGHSRQWNIAHNPKYIEAILNNTTPVTETEELSHHDLYNEYIMTGLRLSRGIEEVSIIKFGDSYINKFKRSISPHIASGYVAHSNGNYTLTRSGKIFADRIASDCFIIKDDY
jgi:putative oxygen-independent coproporphyrinogen III oxidase